MFHQNPPANKTFSKSSLYAIKNGCYGPFYCPRCNNHYMWKKNLMRHMKLECGKEPSFQCPICPLRTKHKSSLLGHIRNKHFINLNAWKMVIKVDLSFYYNCDMYLQKTFVCRGYDIELKRWKIGVQLFLILLGIVIYLTDTVPVYWLLAQKMWCK